jgi:hypothetical protein
MQFLVSESSAFKDMDRRLERSGKGRRKVERKSILEAQEKGVRHQVAHQGLVCRMGLSKQSLRV